MTHDHRRTFARSRWTAALAVFGLAGLMACGPAEDGTEDGALDQEEMQMESDTFPQDTAAQDTQSDTMSMRPPADDGQEEPSAPAGEMTSESNPASGAPAGRGGDATEADDGEPRRTAASEDDGAAEAEEPAPRMVTVETGATLQATLDQELSTEKSRVGETFTATVTTPVVAGGELAVPEGATLEGEVTAVQKSGKSGQQAVLKLNFSRIEFRGETYPVAVEITQAEADTKSRTSTGEAAGRVGAGAAAGAILGRVLGGDTKGTLIGAAAGAAAGTAIVLASQDVDAVLPEGAPITLRVTEPLVVRAPEE